MTLVETMKDEGQFKPSLLSMKGGATPKGIVPQNIEEVLTLAETFACSQMCPQAFRGNIQDVATAIFYGLEVGLPPFQAMQNIAVVNGRPCLWGDALPALMYKHGHSLDESIEGEGDDMIATCILTRGDTGHSITKTFSMKQAKKAGLAGKGVWSKYPERMLQMRARGFAIRDGASDAMVGLAVAEEVQDYQEAAQVKNVTPPSPPSPKIEKKEEPEEAPEDFDAKKERLDSDLAIANDLKTLNEIWNEFERSNDISDDELEEANNTFNEHMERIGE